MADVVFLLDMSTNSSWEDFDYLKEFLEESISALDIKEYCMRVGLVAYSNETKVISTLSRGVNKSEVLQDIQSLAPQAGKAYTGAALRKIRTIIRQPGFVPHFHVPIETEVSHLGLGI